MRRVACLTGTLCLAAATGGFVGNRLPARADAASPGSSLGTFGLTAAAPGVQITYDFPNATTHPMAEGSIPQSVAQLSSGPVGYALATVAWPGPLVGNLGATTQVLGLGLPPTLTNTFNDPVRAEARTGVEPSTVDNSSVPGTTMHASANDALVDSNTTTGGVQGPAPRSTLGRVETHSRAVLTGPSSAEAAAETSFANVDIGGVIHIASLVSTADATTNAVTARVHGGTTVAGMTIGGVPATLDDRGLHFASATQPVNAIAGMVAEQALAGLGMQLYLSQPIARVHGANASYLSGSLVLYWRPPSDPNGDTFTLTLGGASAGAAAVPGFGSGPAPAAPPLVPPSATSASGDVGVPSGPTSAAANVGPQSAGSHAAGSHQTGSQQTGSHQTGSSRLAIEAAAETLPHGLSATWPILAVLAAALLALGMRRAPDRVLLRSSNSCPLGGDR